MMANRIRPERQQLIRALFDEHIEMYASRDERLTAHFSENFSGYAGGGTVLVKDRAEWARITRQDFSQVTGRIRIEMLDFSMQDISADVVIATAFFHIHLPVPDLILSRETARLVLVFRLEGEDWKIVHNGISIPYHLVQEGEIYPLRGLQERNSELATLVEERTLALQKSEARFRSFVENANDVLFALSTAGTFSYLSPQWKASFGYEGSECLNQNFAAFVHPDDVPGCWAFLQQVVATGKKHSGVEFRVRCKNGTYLWYKANAALIKDPVNGEPTIIGIGRDITERKQAETELLAAKACAEQANHAKSRFLAAASHDLRQPLTALALFVGVLKQKFTLDCSAQVACAALVSRIEVCIDSLSELLTDLLDVSKLDAGVVTPKPSDFSVDELLDTFIALQAGEAERKGLRLRVRHSGAFGRTDPQLLHRILGNLMANAINHTEQGGVLLACRRHQGKQWIEVWDTGPGIAPDQTSLIFEEFRQLGDGSRNRGSGLGLAIVAKAAALLGLQIRLQSRPGRGSMFAIEVPPGRASRPSTATAPLAAPRALRIAMVEDNPLVLQALSLALEREGHQVMSATSGRQLLEQLGQHRPDLVISDYRLAQHETGFDVIQGVRDLFGSTLPAFLITGDTDPALVRSMADRGIAVLYKPLQMDILQTFIRDAAERRRA